MYSTCKNICLNSFAAVPLGAPSTTLYPLDRGGALFSTFFAAAFTVSLLHFSPLATFDALGPSFLSPLCVCALSFFFLSFFFSISVVSPPSPLSVFLPLSLFLTFSLSLPSPRFVEVKLLAAWESVPYKLPTPTVRSVQAGQTPGPPSTTTTTTISPLHCVYLMCPQ